MSDLTRPDNGEAMERLTTKLKELGHDEVGAYFLLFMAILAKNAPDVLTFLMDRADTRLAESDCVLGDHDWTLRPESDTWVCEACGAER